jgi:hypothetical protein
MPFDNPRQGPFSDIDILLDARSRIDHPDRWIKGVLRKRNRRCLVAALILACTSRRIDRRTQRRLAFRMVRQLPVGRLQRAISFMPMQRLIRFNDSPDTTHDHVMALFDRTIQKLMMKALATVSE